MFGIGDAVAAGLKVIDKFVPDPEAKAKAEAELRASLQAWDGQQAEVNKAEAQHSSKFIAGWRPAIGWVCATGLAWAFLVQPVAVWAVAAFGPDDMTIPVIPTEGLFELVFAMLGIGGLRTYEKLKGVAAR